ncbi:MAG: radical SAM protein, partial [Candidatus Aenigmatarchaeota archaeon]
MKITLIHDPYHYQKSTGDHITGKLKESSLKEKNPNNYVPIDLMYASSILKEMGDSVKLIDANADNLKKEEVLNILKDLNPDLIGLKLIFSTLNISLQWLKYLKGNLNVPIFVWGPAVSLYSKILIRTSFIDFCLIDPLIKSLPKMKKAIKRDGLNNLKGISDINPKRKLVGEKSTRKERNLDKYPWPDREITDNQKYEAIFLKGSPMTLLYSSTGCSYNCKFCSMGKSDYKERDIDDVVDEIEEIIDKQNIKSIRFYDRNFLSNKEKCIELCQKIIERDLDFNWDCMARVDEVDEEILSLMKKAGCQL